jgi:hypothetical protein
MVRNVRSALFGSQGVPVEVVNSSPLRSSDRMDCERSRRRTASMAKGATLATRTDESVLRKSDRTGLLATTVRDR